NETGGEAGDVSVRPDGPEALDHHRVVGGILGPAGAKRVVSLAATCVGIHREDAEPPRRPRQGVLQHGHWSRRGTAQLVGLWLPAPWSDALSAWKFLIDECHNCPNQLLLLADSDGRLLIRS